MRCLSDLGLPASALQAAFAAVNAPTVKLTRMKPWSFGHHPPQKFRSQNRYHLHFHFLAADLRGRDQKQADREARLTAPASREALPAQEHRARCPVPGWSDVAGPHVGAAALPPDRPVLGQDHVLHAGPAQEL